MAAKLLTSGGPPVPATPGMDFLSELIPNYKNLLQTAAGNIGTELEGGVSPAIARNAGATAAAEMGVSPGSDIIGRYDYDLYNQLGQQRQRQGLQDLGGLIGSTASPTLTATGQQQQQGQYYAGLNEQSSQFGQQLDLQQFMDQVQALIGLSQAGFGGGGTPSGVSGSGTTSNPFDSLGGAVNQFRSYLPSTSNYSMPGNFMAML